MQRMRARALPCTQAHAQQEGSGTAASRSAPRFSVSSAGTHRMGERRERSTRREIAARLRADRLV